MMRHEPQAIHSEERALQALTEAGLYRMVGKKAEENFDWHIAGSKGEIYSAQPRKLDRYSVIAHQTKSFSHLNVASFVLDDSTAIESCFRISAKVTVSRVGGWGFLNKRIGSLHC